MFLLTNIGIWNVDAFFVKRLSGSEFAIRN